jgi:4-amino-4-deoxy-L-arabinose transferase-like glycosyltransferase
MTPEQITPAQATALPRSYGPLVSLLCLATFLLVAIVAWRVFDAMPHLEDEHAYLYQAKIFAQGQVTAAARNADAFPVPFVLDIEGKRFGKYSPGYPLLLASGALVGQPWLVNALAAALCVLGVYLLGRDLFDDDSGALAAALGALSPMFLLLSGMLLSHTATSAALVLFAWAFVRARRDSGPSGYRFALLGGALAGLAQISRPWTAVGVGLPFALLALWELLRLRRVRLYAAMALAFALVALVAPLYNTLTAGSPSANLYRLWWEYDRVGFGPGVGRSPAGHRLPTALGNARDDLALLQEVLLGWRPVAGLPLAYAPLAAGLALAPHSRREWALLAIAGSLVVAYLAYWVPGGALLGPRYYAEAMPFLWLLAARGLLKIARVPWGSRALRLALPLLIGWGALFTTPTWLGERRALYATTRDDARVIAAAGLDDALVFVRSDTWTEYARLSWLNTPDLDGDVVFALNRGAARNRLLRAQFPGRAVYFYDLRARPTLVEYAP